MLSRQVQYQGKAGFFKLNFQFSNSRNTGKCKLGWFLFRQSQLFMCSLFFWINFHVLRVLTEILQHENLLSYRIASEYNVQGSISAKHGFLCLMVISVIIIFTNFFNKQIT